MYDNFEDVAVGDAVKCSRGRSRDAIAKVYHVTPKQFAVEGFGKFWKETGKGVGNSGSWYGRYANKIEHGDIARIKAENQRVKNSNAYSEHRVRDFNDDELARVGAIIRECVARREAEEAKYK
jgi:hypothetical protein